MRVPVRRAVRRLAMRAMVVAALTLGATAPSGAQGANSAQAVADVRAAATKFIDALNALDLAGMTTLFAEDITAFVPTAQPDRVNGKAAVTAIYRAYVDRARAGGPTGRTVPQDLTVEASGDLGVVTFNVRDASGTVRRRTFIFRRSGGVWRINHFHASDFAAPKAP